MTSFETYLFHTLDKMHTIALILLFFMTIATGTLFFIYTFEIATHDEDADKIIPSIRKIAVLLATITAVLIVAVVFTPSGDELKEILNPTKEIQNNAS